MVSPFASKLDPFVYDDLSVYLSSEHIELFHGNLVMWFKIRSFLQNTIIERLRLKFQTGIILLFLICFTLLTYVIGTFLFNGTFGLGVWGPWAVVASQ
jgi:hypothetical protein